MTTHTLSADAAEPASSHRDDPGPPSSSASSRAGRTESSDEPASADADPPEPAGQKPEHPAIVRSGDLAIDQSPDASGDSDLTINAADDLTHDIDFLWLDGNLRSAAIHLPLPVGRVSIRIVGDSEMTDLNRRFHDADETTDVLTFCSATPPEGGLIDADIALCADEAARQSLSRGHRIERELLLYALHGLLHCCGFDDGDVDEFRSIHAEEDRILTAIGVGATFADDHAPSRPEERRR